MTVIRQSFVITAIAFLFAELPGLPFASARGAREDDGDGDDGDAASEIADQLAGDAGPEPPPASQGPQSEASPAPAAPIAPKTVAEAAADAHVAFGTAKTAAAEANKVANHSVQLANHAQTALKRGMDELHKARVNTAGLSHSQKHSLKAAEAKLKEATKAAEYGQLKNAKYVNAKVENQQLQKLEKKMDTVKNAKASKKGKTTEQTKVRDEELEAMREEIEKLRKEVKAKEGQKSEDDQTLKELQDQIREMEQAEAKGDKRDQKSHDEMKAEIERLRSQIADMEDDKANVTYDIPKADSQQELPKNNKEDKVETQDKSETKYDVKVKPMQEKGEKISAGEDTEAEKATPVEVKGIDIDTAMPYGDLEPFGREDTAQELTEDSIKQSDDMVDQLEKAEVAEEKRAVFRALTRLRGAAITSFDGVARSQTGNIDEYNQIHKWRSTHPLHHLADEESDVSKWAFPDNADF